MDDCGDGPPGCDTGAGQISSDSDESDGSEDEYIENIMPGVGLVVQEDLRLFFKATCGEFAVVSQSRPMDFLLDFPGDPFCLHQFNDGNDFHVLDAVELRLGFETSYRCLICCVDSKGVRKTGKKSFSNIKPQNICDHLRSDDHSRRRLRLQRSRR
jgi:hypothetical protein